MAKRYIDLRMVLAAHQETYGEESYVSHGVTAIEFLSSDLTEEQRSALVEGLCQSDFGQVEVAQGFLMALEGQTITFDR